MSAKPSTSRRTRKRVALTVAAIVLLGAAGTMVWRHGGPKRADAAAQVRPPVPVTVATASRQDVPIYLSGLGTIQAYNTTAIHTQIDGKLQSVAFTEGQEVHAGDVLAQIDPRFYQAALDQAKAKRAQDEAQLVSARKDLQRYQTLAARSFETQQNVDRQIGLVDQLKASIQADAAAIDSAGVQLTYTTITAPTDGRVGIRQVDPGNIVHVADTTPIAVLTQMRPIAVTFTLPEASLADVRDAMARGKVTVDAYDQNDTRLLATGTLLLVDNQIDQATSTIKLKATFANDDEALWPGEFIHARVLADTRKDAVTVPSAAVQRGPDALFTWVVRPDGIVRAQTIDIGPAHDGTTIVTSGLAIGDQVVVDGQYRLQAGARVNVSPLAKEAAR